VTNDDFDLSGTRAVVTGAARGIGAEIAVALARAGADVAAIDLRPGDEVVAAVERLGRRIVFLQGSTADSTEVERLGDTAVSELGGLEIWVNNAARILAKPLLETTDAHWSELLATNLNGYFYGCRAAARRMVAQGSGGRIVNVGSVSGIVGVGGIGAYTAAKGAIAALSKALAVELGGHGITVNTIAPGAVDTPLNEDVYTPAVRRTYEERVPLGRIATPEEIAAAAVFLASPAARYVTGHQLVVDGGLIVNGTVGHAG
jgi:NAD(P)-dependent dehydrogenase (short-subunit alcohol dehydrogenase family)